MESTSNATQTNPASVEEAQAMLEQIAQNITQLQNQYNQLQLRAAWLQGWIANQTNGAAAQSQTAPKSAAKKK